MSVPQTKAELLLAIDKNFSKLISYLNTIHQKLLQINQWTDTQRNGDECS